MTNDARHRHINSARFLIILDSEAKVGLASVIRGDNVHLAEAFQEVFAILGGRILYAEVVYHEREFGIPGGVAV